MRCAPSSRRCPASTASTTCTSGPPARPTSCSPRTSSCPAGHPDDAFFRAARGAHAGALRDRPRHPAGLDRAADGGLRRAEGAPTCGARARRSATRTDRPMKYKDYYETLGVPRAATAGRHQEGLPQARPQVPPGREQGAPTPRSVQGDQRSQRGAEGSGEARRLRPDGQQLEGRPGVPAAAELGCRLRVPQRRAGRSSGAAARSAPTSTRATSSSRCSAAARARAGGASARRSVSTQGEDHRAKALIDLEDAYRGAERSIVLRVPKETADGRVALEERRLDVHIPRGIRPGQQLRLAKQGAPGGNGGPPGDLYLEIAFNPHPLLQASTAPTSTSSCRSLPGRRRSARPSTRRRPRARCSSPSQGLGRRAASSA